MDKIFDHSFAYKGWQPMADPQAYIRARFDAEGNADRDQAQTYIIEHWSAETGKITFHVASCTGWYHGEPPMADEYVEDSLKGWGREPTTMSPVRDYLIIPRFSTKHNWPPAPEK